MNAPKITLREAFSFYSEHCKSAGKRPSSLKLNAYALDNLEQYLDQTLGTSQINLDSMDRFVIRRFLIWLREEKSLSASTVQRIYDVLSAMFRFLLWDELIAESPLEKVAKPPRNQHPISPLNVEQVQALINACDETTFTGLRNRLIVALLFDTGVRATELCMLDLSDVDLQTCRALLRHTKSGVPRHTYFNKVVSSLLAAYLLTREPHFCSRLIVTRTGGPVDRHWLRRALCRVGEKAGVPVHPHLLRHSCAVESIRNGSDVSVVMRVLGHTNPRMSLHYSQLADAHVQEVHNRTSPADRLVIEAKKWPAESKLAECGNDERE